MDPNWRENIINVLNQYRPDCQISKDDKSTNKKFHNDLVKKILNDLNDDCIKKRWATLNGFRNSCKQILTPYFIDKGTSEADVYSLIDNLTSGLFKIPSFETRIDCIENQSNDCTKLAPRVIDNPDINFINDKIKYHQTNINYCISKISDCNEKINSRKEKLLTYRKYLVSDPEIAPLYKPFQDWNETHRELINTGRFIGANSITYELGNMGLIKWIPDHLLIDLKDENTKQIIETLKAVKGSLKTVHQIQIKYKIPPSYVFNSDIPRIEFTSQNPDYQKTLTLFEINDTSQKVLEEQRTKYQRTKQVPLDKYYCIGDIPPKERYISATKLMKLGFFSAKGLTRRVENGSLKGFTKQVETQSGPKTQAYIDLSVPDNIQKLVKLRDNNETTLPFSTFAQAAGISQRSLLENIKEGHVDIIKDIILDMDLGNIYIDLNLEKNRQFLFEKQFEQQLKREQTQQQREAERINNQDYRSRYTSLRMKLVWQFCPQTKQIASQIASKDGYLCKLLEKENNDEELTFRERIKVNSYRKNLWLTAGCDELKEGFKQADRILATYKKSGIDSIEDENIRNIIKSYFE